jgi:acyl-CoA thioester hydrolase
VRYCNINQEDKDMKNSHVKLELRIDWSEIDLFGHVNNLAILKYVQAAKVNYLEIIVLMQLQSKIKIGPILASTTCQFRKPLFYPGMVTIYTKVVAIKNTSFHFKHEIVNEKEEVIAEVQDVIVLYDFNKNSKVLIPEEIKSKIIDLEGSSFQAPVMGD